MAGMFDNLTSRLTRTLEALRGRGRITEENIGETLREVRVALLEADVALPVVRTFIEAVKAKAIGSEVASSLTPGQAFIGILHRELVDLMGGPRAGINLRAQPPIIVLLAGLQGAGKTTTAAKLAQTRAAREHRRAQAGSNASARAPCAAGECRLLPREHLGPSGRHRARSPRGCKAWRF
jgi:signal recognition particle subunit SRP54